MANQEDTQNSGYLNTDVTSDSPQSDVAAQGLEGGVGYALSQPEVQAHLDIDQNLKNFADMASAAATGNESAQMALAEHSAGIAMGTVRAISPLEGVLTKAEGIAGHESSQALRNSLTTQQIGRKLYLDEVNRANAKARAVKKSSGGTLMMAEGGEVPLPEGADEFIASQGTLPQVQNQAVGQTPVSQTAVPMSQSSDELPEGADEFLDEFNPHSGGLEQVKAGLEGAAEGIAGPFAPLVETKLLGVDPANIRGRAEANPITHEVAKYGTLAASMLTGVGEGALLLKGGATAAKAALPLFGEGIAAKMGSAAVQAGVENMILASGDEISKTILNDPSQSAQSAIADIGLSTVLGGVIGGSIASISPLWQKAFGNKLSQEAANFKGALVDHFATPDPLVSSTDELNNFYKNINAHADEVYGATGLKSQAIEKALPEINNQMFNHADSVSSDLIKSIDKMRAKPNSYPERLVSKIEDEANAYIAATKRPDVTASDLFNASQELKQNLQGFAKFDKFVKPVDEAYDFVKESKSLAHSLRESLEDSKIFGNAAKVQRDVNKAFSEHLPKLKDFQSKFMEKQEGEYVISPTKVNTFLNQIDKPQGEVKRSMLKNFIKSSNSYLDTIANTYETAGLSNPVEHTSLNTVLNAMKEKTSGQQLANWLVGKAGGDALAGSIGAGIGAEIGHPILGGILGKELLGNKFNSIISSIIKPILNNPASGAGLKSAIDYAKSAAAGQQGLIKASKALFKAGALVSVRTPVQLATMRNKLDSQLKEFQTQPEKMAGVGDHLNHYMPDHGAQIAASSMNAVNYLNNLRPGSVKAAPLDNNLPSSPVAKARYNTALDIANDPMILMSKMKEGTVTPNDIMDVRAMYPQLYQGLATKVMIEMTNHMAKGDSVPYKTRLGLSQFLGQAMDSTLTPGAIMSAQIQGPGSSDQQQAAQSQQPKQHNTKALNKVSMEYNTPAQNRVSRQQAGK